MNLEKQNNERNDEDSMEQIREQANNLKPPR